VDLVVVDGIVKVVVGGSAEVMINVEVNVAVVVGVVLMLNGTLGVTVDAA